MGSGANMLKMKINDLSQRAQESLTSVLRENSIGYQLSEKSELGTYDIEIDMRFIRVQSMMTSDTIILMNDAIGTIFYLLAREDYSYITVI